MGDRFSNEFLVMTTPAQYASVTELVYAVFSQQPRIEQTIYGPDNKPIQVVFGFQPKVPEENPRQMIYTKIGQRMLVDHRLQRWIHVFLKKNSTEQVLYLHEFDTIMQESHVHAEYSSLAIYALDYVDVRGRTFLDLGAADGLCSLVALHNGAKHAIAVDIDPRRLAVLPRHLETNAMDPTRATTQWEDITWHDFKEKIPKDGIDVVCANLGAHQYEDEPNVAAILLLEHLPRARYFIGGGYAEDEPHRPDDDIELLAEMGFRNVRWVRQQRSDQVQYPKCAFIAERQ